MVFDEIAYFAFISRKIYKIGLCLWPVKLLRRRRQKFKDCLVGTSNAMKIQNVAAHMRNFLYDRVMFFFKYFIFNAGHCSFKKIEITNKKFHKLVDNSVNEFVGMVIDKLFLNILVFYKFCKKGIEAFVCCIGYCYKYFFCYQKINFNGFVSRCVSINNREVKNKNNLSITIPTNSFTELSTSL